MVKANLSIITRAGGDPGNPPRDSFLMADPRFVKSRYLGPGNPKSAKKDFYNPNIVAEFDKQYTRRK
jgi:hypothetical protein